MSEIKNELDTLPLRAMLAAAFITYLSAAPEDTRTQCLQAWTTQSGLQSRNVSIRTSSQHNRARYLSSPVKHELTMELTSGFHLNKMSLFVSSSRCKTLVCPLCWPEFDLRSFLSTESEQLIWKSQGLPSDDLSVENALIILQVYSVTTHLVSTD